MKPPPLSLLLAPDYITGQVLKVHRAIRRSIRERPEESFQPYWFDTPTGKKQLATVDFVAEQTFIAAITNKFGGQRVRVLGEESLYSNESDLRAETRTCVLIDMIDGTDLLQRDFSNWCSAIVVFDPKNKKIKGSFVALDCRQRALYFATERKPGAFKKALSVGPKVRNGRPIKLPGPAKTRLLQNAGLCLYAQKDDSLLDLLGLARKPKLVEWLRRHIEANNKKRRRAETELRFRFYNLAGNPMMVRLAEGVVDVVFDIRGQVPHDVVPGSFIALKAGAVMGKANSDERLTEDDLALSLLQPNISHIDYVLAANKHMYRNIVSLLSTRRSAKRRS